MLPIPAFLMIVEPCTQLRRSGTRLALTANPAVTQRSGSIGPLLRRDLLWVGTCRLKWKRKLCQNCVTYPPKPWGNTVIYGDTSTHIDVAEVVESEVRWWDLMCVSTRERIQFPSVLLQPLGHLSV